MSADRYVLAYSVTRARWMVEDTVTGRTRRFATRDKAIAALDKLIAAQPHLRVAKLRDRP